MTHHITPEADGRRRSCFEHSERAHVLNEAVLDHHIEELLLALGDPGLLRRDMDSEDDV